MGKFLSQTDASTKRTYLLVTVLFPPCHDNIPYVIDFSSRSLHQYTILPTSPWQPQGRKTKKYKCSMLKNRYKTVTGKFNNSWNNLYMDGSNHEFVEDKGDFCVLKQNKLQLIKWKKLIFDDLKIINVTQPWTQL